MVDSVICINIVYLISNQPKLCLLRKKERSISLPVLVTFFSDVVVYITIKVTKINYWMTALFTIQLQGIYEQLGIVGKSSFVYVKVNYHGKLYLHISCLLMCRTAEIKHVGLAIPGAGTSPQTRRLQPVTHHPTPQTPCNVITLAIWI